MKDHATTGQAFQPAALPYRKVTVVGAGSWGTALAVVLARAGCDTTICGRDPAIIDEINTKGTTERFLPGVKLPEGLRGTTDMPKALEQAEAVLVVVPS
jgi:glycerol-3-phosphate dehydrogenase (NAD(P)+)